MARGGADAEEDTSDHRVGWRLSPGLPRLALTGGAGCTGRPQGPGCPDRFVRTHPCQCGPKCTALPTSWARGSAHCAVPPASPGCGDSLEPRHRAPFKTVSGGSLPQHTHESALRLGVHMSYSGPFPLSLCPAGPGPLCPASPDCLCQADLDPCGQPALTPYAKPALTPCAQPALTPYAKPALTPCAQPALTLYA